MAYLSSGTKRLVPLQIFGVERFTAGANISPTGRLRMWYAKFADARQQLPLGSIV